MSSQDNPRKRLKQHPAVQLSAVDRLNQFFERQSLTRTPVATLREMWLEDIASLRGGPGLIERRSNPSAERALSSQAGQAEMIEIDNVEKISAELDPDDDEVSVERSVNSDGDEVLGADEQQTDEPEEEQEPTEDEVDYRGIVTDPETGDPMMIEYWLTGPWESRIRQLYDTPAIDTPPGMVVQPHEHQLLAAAQGHFLCKSSIRGIILGDTTGLGKTLSAILMMWLAKDDAGFSVVVAPKTLCHQWVKQIKGSFKPVSTTPLLPSPPCTALHTNIC